MIYDLFTPPLYSISLTPFITRHDLLGFTSNASFLLQTPSSSALAVSYPNRRKTKTNRWTTTRNPTKREKKREGIATAETRCAHRKKEVDGRREDLRLVRLLNLRSILHLIRGRTLPVRDLLRLRKYRKKLPRSRNRNHSPSARCFDQTTPTNRKRISATRKA